MATIDQKRMKTETKIKVEEVRIAKKMKRTRRREDNNGVKFKSGFLKGKERPLVALFLCIPKAFVI